MGLFVTTMFKDKMLSCIKINDNFYMPAWTVKKLSHYKPHHFVLSICFYTLLPQNCLPKQEYWMYYVHWIS